VTSPAAIPRLTPEQPRPRPARRAAVLGCLLALAAWSGIGRAAGRTGQPPADVVARVNGRPILRRDFDLAVQLSLRRRRGDVSLEDLKTARAAVLDALIDNELLYQQATSGVTVVTDAEVRDEETRMRTGLGDAELAALLEENGVSGAEFTEQVRRTLLVTRFVNDRVVVGVKIGDDEVRRIYDQNPRDMVRPDAVRISQIMLRVAPDAAPAVRAGVRQKMEAILQELRAGQDFADMARKYSEGPEAARGGDAGFLTRGGGGSPAIEEAAFSLRPGTVSDVLETRMGFHVIEVLEKRAGGPIPFEEAQKSIRARLEAAARDAMLRDYLAGLRQKAPIVKSPGFSVPTRPTSAPGPAAPPPAATPRPAASPAGPKGGR
jgi:peptidyl-prolyl cis-trans isomerase C